MIHPFRIIQNACRIRIIVRALASLGLIDLIVRQQGATLAPHEQTTHFERQNKLEIT